MILKIYITLFIIGYFINFFSKRRGTLACGIWGFCGSSSPESQKLALLALYNLKRGEHATGYYADGVINKATKPANVFLAENYQNMQELNKLKNFVVIGHDRQASIGVRDNLEQAHPHGIKNDDKYDLVLVHNGTLTNYHAMAEHYKIPTAGSSDSQILTKILGSVEETEIVKVLSQYEGTATVVFTLPKYKHKMFVHRDPEREIYFFQEAPDRMYISSIKEALMAIGGTDETVFEFNKYEIASISKGKIVRTWKTDKRDPITYYQKKTTAPWNGRNQQLNFIENTGSKSSFFQRNNTVSHENGFVYKDSYYWLNGHKHTGVMYINSLTNEWCKEHLDGFQKFWFIRGNMMIDENHYDTIMDTCKENGSLSIAKFEKHALVLTCEHTMYPMLGGVDITQGTLFYPGKHHRKTLNIEGTKSMSFIPLLSNTIFRINHLGLLISKTDVKDSPEPRERKIVTEAKDLMKSIEFCLNNSVHTDFTGLFLSVRYMMKEEDTPAFYKKVVDGFVSICNVLGVIEDEWVQGLKVSNSRAVEKKQQDELNTLLQIYYTWSEETFSQIQPTDNYWLKNPKFLETLEMVEYTSLEKFFVDFVEDDREENTKPFLMAVAHELARMGIIPAKIVDYYNEQVAPDIFKAIERDYETYVALSDKKTDSNCCVSDPTALVAEIYKKYSKLNENSAHLTEDEQLEYAELKQQLKILIKNGRLNKNELRKKYDLTVNKIIETI